MGDARRLVRGRATSTDIAEALDDLGIGDGGEFLIVAAVNARSSDPFTSAEAWERFSKTPALDTQRGRALQAIREAGRPVTPRYVTERVSFDAWKRISELKQGGHVVVVGHDAAENAELLVPRGYGMGDADPDQPLFDMPSDPPTRRPFYDSMEG